MVATRQQIRGAILFFVLLVFPITLNYYSPYLIIESAAQGIANFSFFLWTTWLVSSLVIGRIACAYICPLGAAQRVKHHMWPSNLRRASWPYVIKYVLALAWVAGIIWAAASAGGYHQVKLLYNTESGVSVDSVQGLVTYYMILTIALMPTFFLGKRAFCHYFCPFGVLNIVGTSISRMLRLPRLHLRATPERCRRCGRCTRACPMALPVDELVASGSMADAECILCGTCVDTCRYGTLRYAFGRTPRDDAESKS
jgi:polyferredoxin